MMILLLLLGKLFFIFLVKLILSGGIALAISILTSIFKFLASLWFSGIPIGNEQTIKIPSFIKRMMVRKAWNKFKSDNQNYASNSQTYDILINDSSYQSVNKPLLFGVLNNLANKKDWSAIYVRIAFVLLLLIFSQTFVFWLMIGGYAGLAFKLSHNS